MRPKKKQKCPLQAVKLSCAVEDEDKTKQNVGRTVLLQVLHEHREGRGPAVDDAGSALQEGKRFSLLSFTPFTGRPDRPSVCMCVCVWGGGGVRWEGGGKIGVGRCGDA